MAGSPGTNRNVLVHISEISPKPQSNSKQAVRLTKGAQKNRITDFKPLQMETGRSSGEENSKETTDERKPAQKSNCKKPPQKIPEATKKSKHCLSFVENAVVESSIKD
jgi:hypothetical protein